MVIFLLAMVITILMTIASEKMMVFGSSGNGRFRRRCPRGERTDKLQKSKTPSPEAEKAEMYIYTLSENLLQSLWPGRPLALADSKTASAHGLAAFGFLPFCLVCLVTVTVAVLWPLCAVAVSEALAPIIGGSRPKVCRPLPSGGCRAWPAPCPLAHGRCLKKSSLAPVACLIFLVILHCLTIERLLQNIHVTE